MSADLAVNLVGEQDAKWRCNQAEPEEPNNVIFEGIPEDWGGEEDVVIVGKTSPTNIVEVDAGPECK